MAEASYLHIHGEDEDDRGDVLVSLDSIPYCSHEFDGFDIHTSDLDVPPSDLRISSLPRHPPRRSSSRGFTDNVSGTESITNPDIFDRGNQVNFVMDLFRQRVEQSSSRMEGRFGEMGTNSFDVDLDLGLGLPGTGGMGSNNFEVDLDLGLGLGFSGGGVDRNDDEFMVADSGDDFFMSRRRTGTVPDSGESTTGSGCPEYYLSGLHVVDIESDSDDAGEIEEGFDDENARYDDDASLRACWAAFQLADEGNNSGEGNEDFEWEEVGGGIDEREVVGMFFDAEADDDDASVFARISTAEELVERRVDELEWEVLLNARNLEANPELGQYRGPFDEYNYGEYEVFFGQFADNDNALVGRPPASKTAVENLLSVAITLDDCEKNKALCAVCNDEINFGQMAKQMPCSHRYHGECIVPWLGIRNTCPVCRFELPTDDPDYERRRAGRAGHAN